MNKNKRIKNSKSGKSAHYQLPNKLPKINGAKNANGIEQDEIAKMRRYFAHPHRCNSC